MARSKHIATLVLCHLLVFITPLVIKDTHRHTHVDEQQGIISHATLLKAEEHCFICNYELVSYTPAPENRNYTCLPSVQLSDVYVYSVDYEASFSYFSHRAPPLN